MVHVTVSAWCLLLSLITFDLDKTDGSCTFLFSIYTLQMGQATFKARCLLLSVIIFHLDKIQGTCCIFVLHSDKIDGTCDFLLHGVCYFHFFSFVLDITNGTCYFVAHGFCYGHFFSTKT